ncbi:unnamed protein product [Brassica rapa subsp. trilocularis]
MAAKYNSVIVIVFMVVMMIMAMEKVDGETSAECRDRCSQSCAMTGALPAKCLQSCYSRCQGLPSQTIGNYFFMFILTKKIRQKSFFLKCQNKCRIYDYCDVL